MPTKNAPPTPHVTAMVAHVHDPAVIEPTEVPAAYVAAEREPAVQLPPAPHPGYRPVGSPPWFEP